LGAYEIPCNASTEYVYLSPAYSECYYDRAEDINSVQPVTNNYFTVYPNPVDDILVISSSGETISYVEFVDISGNKVYNKYLNTSRKDVLIDIHFFTSGLYFLKIYDTNEHVSLFKIIKN
jgi:hypothetical protein